jgi:hypothetical protein
MVSACGAIGYLLLVLGTLGVLVSFGALIALLATPNRRVGMLAGAASLILGFVTIGLASLGTRLGRNAVDSAAAAVVDPSDAERLRTAGYAEAAQCLPVGVLSGALPLLAGVAVVIAATLRKDGAEEK